MIRPAHHERIVARGEIKKLAARPELVESRADSGNTFNRGFCPTCGGRVFAKSSAFPQFVLITAGSLDDPSQFKPAMDFFTSSAQPSDHMDPNLPKFAKQAVRVTRDNLCQLRFFSRGTL